MEQTYLPGNIHKRLEDLMKSRKITQTELAQKIGVMNSMTEKAKANGSADE